VSSSLSRFTHKTFQNRLKIDFFRMKTVKREAFYKARAGLKPAAASQVVEQGLSAKQPTVDRH
jgi:hypothetical protein